MVSIIIPAFNKVNHTLNCLKTLNDRTPTSISTEIIVVDNASTDSTHEVLSQLTDHITVIRNQTNEGYAAAANKGASVAKADLLLFMHNDISVLPGWLAPLYDAMVQDAQLGAVQPRLTYTDGRLYSAGGLIFADECIEFGQGIANPRRDQYSTRRTVDYASSAAVLVRKSAFDAIGGFNEQYTSAKYVTADFSMSLATKSMKTIYEPASDMMHVGSDSNALLETNMPESILVDEENDKSVFGQKWSIDLMYRPKYAIDTELEWATRSHGNLDALPARSPILT